jgi:hypothetical protein
LWLTIAHYDRDGRYFIHHKPEGGYVLSRAKLSRRTQVIGHFTRMDDAKAYAEAEYGKAHA